MEKIYKVFVSSTYEDLREERSDAQKALLKMGCLPVGMEIFPAADDETWDFIKKQIDDSDYYIVIVAGKYGSISPDTGTGYTEMEYEYAVSMKKRVLGFLHSDLGSIPKSKSELDGERANKLSAFTTKIRSRPVNFFRTSAELAMQITVSFVDLRVRYPAVGFIRADEAIEPVRYAEALERIRQLETQIHERDDLATSIESWLNSEVEVTISNFGERVNLTDNWKNIIISAAHDIVANKREYLINVAITIFLLEKSNIVHRNALFDSDSFVKLRTSLVVRGIIEIVSQNSGDRGTVHTWRFTELGKRIVTKYI